MKPTATDHGIPQIDVWAARARIKPYILRTPLIRSEALSRRLNCSVYLKMECWQNCGCFKVRGAVNKIAATSREERSRGLVTASSGNHALAVAYAAGLFSSPPTTIFLPENADRAKVEKIRSFAVEVVFHGKTYVEAYDEANRFCERQGAVYVHSHADPLIIAGQGTLGLEILEDLPDVDAVLVPIGGGGLISGVSSALKAAAPGVRIIGVEPTAAPSAYMSLRDGKCYDRIDTLPSMADGLLGGIGHLPFEIIRRNVERVVLVEEDQIGRATALFQQDEQLMIEAASAVSLAALQNGRLDLEGKKVVLLLTSRNMDAARYNQIVQKYG